MQFIEKMSFFLISSFEAIDAPGLSPLMPDFLVSGTNSLPLGWTFVCQNDVSYVIFEKLNIMRTWSGDENKLCANFRGKMLREQIAWLARFIIEALLPLFSSSF